MLYKIFYSIIFLSFIAINATAQKTTVSGLADSAKKIEIAEVSCGECKFKMEGSGCDLAVRLNGKSYFVDGTNINEHGDAHAKDGFCESIRKAEIQGEVIGNRYKVKYFKLLPQP